MCRSNDAAHPTMAKHTVHPVLVAQDLSGLYGDLTRPVEGCAAAIHLRHRLVEPR